MKALNIPDWLKLDQKYRKYFHAMTVLFGIYVLPIILADRYYQDDLSRSLLGITGWNNDGRPLTEWIMKWLCGGTPIGDIFPLPLLLSVLLLSYVLTLYIRRNLPDCGSAFLSACVGFSVIANPFTLSTLSYRYDCVTMIAALCASVLPYILPHKTALWKVFCFSGVMCMFVFATYQPCCGVYICLGALELFFMILSSEIRPLRIITHAAALCISVPFYYFIVTKRYFADNSWQKSAYRLSFTSGSDFLSSVMKNLDDFKMRMESYLVGVPVPVLFLFLVLMIGGMVCVSILIWKKNEPFRILRVLYALCLPVLIIAGALLPLVVLTPSIFAISAHTLITLCSFGLWSGMMIHFLFRRFPQTVIVLLIPCMLFCFTYSYTYGSALKSQKQYEEYITYNIVRDLETINADGTCHYLTIDGHMSRSKEVAMLCDKYPLYKHIVPLYINNSSYLGGAQLQHYMRQNLEYAGLSEEDALSLETCEPVIQNAVYSCFVNKDKIIVRFHN